MTKAPRLLLALVAGFVLAVLPKQSFAALHPLDLPPAMMPTVPIAPDASITGTDVPLQLSIDLGLRNVESKPAAPLVAPKISLSNFAPFRPGTDFLVGRDASLALPRTVGVNWRLRPNYEEREAWDFLHRQWNGPDSLERFTDLLDIEEQERPWSTTTMVHLLASSSKSGIVPFASIAHEVDVNEDFERFGIGAGAMINIGKNASIGAEILYFSGDHSSSNDAFSKETRFLTRLQLEF